MCVADFDQPSFLFKQWRRSRFGFECDDCAARFPPGTRYLHVTGKWDGHVSSSKRCDGCDDLAAAVDGVDCSWAYGSLLDDAREAVTEHTTASPGAMGRLIGKLWLAHERRSERWSRVRGGWARGEAA